MPLVDLLRKRVLTPQGIPVRTPTVRSFFRALEVFGAEIGIVREAVRQSPSGLAPEVAAAPFLVSPEDGRLAYVLEDCADADAFGSEPNCSEAVMAVTRLLWPILPRLDAMLAPPVPADAVPQTFEPDDDVEPGVLLIFGAAERFKCDPMCVMDWPLGVFVDTIAAYSRPPRTPMNEAVFNAAAPAIVKAEGIVGGPTRAEA